LLLFLNIIYLLSYFNYSIKKLAVNSSCEYFAVNSIILYIGDIMKLEFKDLREMLIFNIKYYRYLNNYSQEKLAELSSLSSRYITDVERGLHCPTINKIEIIAKVLNVEPYEMFRNHEYDLNIIQKMKISRQYNQK